MNFEKCYNTIAFVLRIYDHCFVDSVLSVPSMREFIPFCVFQLMRTAYVQHSSTY